MPSKYNSRRGITLSTANDGFYDEVVSLSQGVINEHFKVLFDKNPAMQKIDFNPPPENDLASFEATLLPPRLLLNVDSTTNTGEVYYILRIKEGKISKDNWEDIILNDWELHAKCNVESFTLRGDREGTEKEKAAIKAARAKQLEVVGRTYIIPDGYDVERLFASLASVPWSQLDERSTCGFDSFKNRITWPTWRKRNGVAGDHLEMALKSWGRTMDNNGYSMMGVKFVLPTRAAVQPTFAPTAVLTQNYPYCDEKNLNGVTGLGGTSDYNCFLYCETVKGRPLPRSVQLNWTGNYAIPRDEHGRKVDGTFAIHHSVVMEKHFLKHLQIICQASELQIQAPVQTVKAGGSISIRPKYSLGCDPYGTPDEKLKTSWDDKFKFTRVGVDEKGDIVYKWNQKQSHSQGSMQSLVQHQFGFLTATVPEWQGYNIKGDSEVIVTFHTGTPRLTLKGFTKFDYDIFWSFEPTGKFSQNYKRYIYRLPWEFSMQLSVTSDGELTADFEQLIGGIPTIDPVQDKWEIKDVDGSTETDLVRFLKENMGGAIRSAREQIQTEMKNSGKFQYPGSGKLIFSYPEFTGMGDLVANITYAPIFEGKIAVPKIEDQLIYEPGAPTPKTKINPEVLPPDSKPVRLEWTQEYKYDPATKRLTLMISAKNCTKDTLYFGWLGIEMVQNADQLAVYNGTAFKPKKADGFIAKLHDFMDWFSSLVHPPQQSKSSKDEVDAKEKTTPYTPSTAADGSANDPAAAAPVSQPPAAPKPPTIPKDDTYTLSHNDTIESIKIHVGYSGPLKLMKCSITADVDPEESGMLPESLEMSPDETITLTFVGRSTPGKYTYLIHEAWKSEDGTGAGKGDAARVVEF